MSETTADAIIVGGGVIGVATAYHLARRGYGRVLVLERAHLGAGSTGSSVASIEPLALFPPVAALQRESILTFQNFAERVGGDCGFVSLPLALFVGESEAPAIRAAMAAARAAGSDADIITPDEFAAREAGCSMEGVAAVYTSRDAGHADPVLTLNSFADAARAQGVTIRQNTPVRGVAVSAGRVVGVETPDGLLSAPTVVLAPGLWVEALLKPLGLTASLSLLRHFVVALEAPPGAPHHSVLDAPFNFYSRPEKSGNLYLLGCAGDFPDADDPDDPSPPVTMDLSFSVLERMVARFPVMEAARLRNGYTGIADMSPDKQPQIGALPVGGLFLAAGMSGVGFKISPGVGAALAGLIAGDADAAALLHPLRPTRFAEGQPLVPPREFSLIA